ncbi:MAG: YicC family protein [Deltaproteobacteria bacterium]|nr:YicC family protein [Deltaproteobacteria bacterium]
MLKSMTAYGRGVYEFDGSIYIAEIRSVNNRYRDIIIRISKDFQLLEDEIKSFVAARVMRGRIEVSVQVEKVKADQIDYVPELNITLLKSYIRIFDLLNEKFGIEGKITPELICQLKDLIVIKPIEPDLERIRSGIKKAIEEAFITFNEMRTREGQMIQSDFLNRIGIIRAYLGEIEKRSPLVIEEYRKKLKERIEDIATGMEVDEKRLIQEVAIFANRSDITEEILRAKSHLEQFLSYMSNDEPIGRRLDFLIQEINREVNTIASKASDSSISKNAVEIKSEMEKIREQVQNIE